MEDIFTKRLAREREERGWDKKQAAQHLGIKYSAYCQYENGNRKPKHEKLVAIASFYGVTVDYLLGNNHFKQSETPDIHAILDLSDEQIVKDVQFKVDHEPLTEAQVRRLIAFVRAERSIENHGH